MPAAVRIDGSDVVNALFASAHPFQFLDRLRAQRVTNRLFHATRNRFAVRRSLRERESDPQGSNRPRVRLGEICVGSVYCIIRERILPATQIMPSAPWQIPVAALDSEMVRIGVRGVVDRRPRNFAILQDTKTLRLPGI